MLGRKTEAKGEFQIFWGSGGAVGIGDVGSYVRTHSFFFLFDLLPIS